MELKFKDKMYGFKSTHIYKKKSMEKKLRVFCETLKFKQKKTKKNEKHN